MSTDLHAAAQALGRKGGLAPKTITDADRAARAERARGLARTRKPRKTSEPPWVKAMDKIVCEQPGQAKGEQ